MNQARQIRRRVRRVWGMGEELRSSAAEMATVIREQRGCKDV
jgi:hypothetical protein